MAEATDASTTDYDYSVQNWVAYASTSDINWAQGNSQDTIEISSNPALTVDPTTITYPTLGVGANSAANWITTTVTTTGNTTIDVHFSGTNMSGAGTLAVGHQKFTTTSPVDYGTDLGAGNTILTTTGESRDLTMSKSTTATPAAANDDTVYWGIAIPLGQTAGAYSGTNTLTATGTVINP